VCPLTLAQGAALVAALYDHAFGYDAAAREARAAFGVLARWVEAAASR
jgi:hypothetical protein